MPCDHRRVIQLNDEGDWEAAHAMVQVHEDGLSCQVHGYLHRIEGDLSNASYWYRRGGMTLPGNTIPQERERLLGLCQ